LSLLDVQQIISQALYINIVDSAGKYLSAHYCDSAID